MALSKNFTLPEKCKNRRRAPRVDSRIDQTVLDSKTVWKEVLFLRGTDAADGFWPRKRKREKTFPAFLLLLLLFVLC